VASNGIGVSGTDFICVPTEDYEKSVAFYRDVIGLRESKQWGQMPAKEFETGSLTIAVMQSDAFGQEFAPHTHPIALHVDDVHAARAELEKKGIEFTGDTIDSGVCHMAIFSDPFGNGLMLHHRYAPKDAKPSAEDLDRASAAASEAAAS
jgi:predicted enzyme related to lactoylglutathione lyase